MSSLRRDVTYQFTCEIGVCVESRSGAATFIGFPVALIVVRDIVVIINHYVAMIT